MSYEAYYLFQIVSEFFQEFLRLHLNRMAISISEWIESQATTGA